MMKKPGNLLKAIQNRRGVTAVIVAICLFMLIGFAALAIDVGYLYSTRNELQNVADAAALAGAGYLGSEYEKLSYSEQVAKTFTREEVVSKVNEVAQKNNAAGVSILIRDAEVDGDIIIGNLDWDHDSPWDHEPPTVNPILDGPDAVQVIARRDNFINQPVATFFAPVFRILDPKYDPRKNVAAIATAALTGPANVEEGELKLPFGLSQYVFDLNKCPTKIFFSKTNESCAGWHNFFDAINGEAMEAKLLGLIKGDTCESCPEGFFDGSTWLFSNFGISPNAELTPTVSSGDEFEFQGGGISKLFNGSYLTDYFDGNTGTVEGSPTNKPAAIIALFDYFRFRDDDGDDSVWTATIPVYKESDGCGNPNTSIEIVGFAKIVVKTTDPPPLKSFEVDVDCNFSVIEGRGGGVTYGNLRGSIPNLVK